MAFIHPDTPAFHHPEITWLYEEGLRIEATKLQTILSLPRPTLVQDLEGILADTREHATYYENLRDEELEDAFQDAPLHAIMLLGELQSKASLPAILDWLSQPDDVVEFWLGEHKTETAWEAFYNLLPNDMQVIDLFLRNPSVDMSTKTTFTDAFTQLALHQPQHRNEVVKMYADLFNHYKGTKNEDDKEFLSFAVGSALEMKATELIPQIMALFDAGVVYEYVNGNKEDALKILSKDEKDYTRAILPIADRYQEIITTWAGYREEDEWDNEEPEDKMEEDDDAEWAPVSRNTDKDESKLLPIRTEAKIGRNDPCPCGSGKKYKKCCMNA